MFKHVQTLGDLLLASYLKPGMVVVDATLGNGHDALKIKRLCPDITLHGFDVQATALERARERLEAAGFFSNCHFHLMGHEKMASLLTDPVDAVVFNLGYLPGNKEGRRTQAKTTLAALASAIALTRPGGVILVMVYPGHPEGRVEKEALIAYLSALDQRKVGVSHHHFINQQKHPPELFLLHKR